MHEGEESHQINSINSGFVWFVLLICGQNGACRSNGGTLHKRPHPHIKNENGRDDYYNKGKSQKTPDWDREHAIRTQKHVKHAEQVRIIRVGEDKETPYDVDINCIQNRKIEDIRKGDEMNRHSLA